MLSLMRALDSGCRSEWIVFGLCLGLAGLSKYTAITLALTSVLFIVFQNRLAVLRSAGPWLAVLVAALLIAPVLYWNATHEWLSFRYQFGHGFRPKDWDWTRVGISQLSQLFAYAPGIYIFGLVALGAGIKEWRERGVQLTLLLVVPVLLLFAAGSGREETLPHWTALVWAGTAPLAARWLLAHWQNRMVRGITHFSAGYSLFLVVLLHALLFFPSLPLSARIHPLKPLTGWPEAAHHAMTLRTQMAAEYPSAVLFVPNWALASRLAWYARPLAVQVTDDRFDQYDLWFSAPAVGAHGVLVAPASVLKKTSHMLTRFDSCQEQDSLPVYRGDLLLTNFHFYLCHGYRGAADGGA